MTTGLILNNNSSFNLEYESESNLNLEDNNNISDKLNTSLTIQNELNFNNSPVDAPEINKFERKSKYVLVTIKRI